MTIKAGIAAAFAKAQGDMTNPQKGTENKFFDSKYADLSQCWKACRAALAANDIAVFQGVVGDRLKTTLIHKSGETLEDEGVPLCGYANAKNPMQALGSAITYARRYGLCAMVGMAPEDDDGNSLEGTGDPRFITEKQAHELNDLADEIGVDKAKFCQFMKVAAISELAPRDFQKAKDMMEKKRVKEAAE